MKCFSLNNNEIVEGIPDTYSNTLNNSTIYHASVRFYVCDQLGAIIADVARQRYADLFLYGYTELIPESEPGNLFPEGSYLLDLEISKYDEKNSKQCMKIQTVEDHVLLGCVPDSVIVTTEGTIMTKDGVPVLCTEDLVEDEVAVSGSVLVLEL